MKHILASLALLLAIATPMVAETAPFTFSDDAVDYKADRNVNVFLRYDMLWSKAKLPDDSQSVLSSSRIGFGFTGGVRMGASDQHELGLFVGFTSYGASFTTRPDAYNFTTNDAKMNSMPILFEYRYQIFPWNDRVGVYAGPLAGFTRLNLTCKYTQQVTTATEVNTYSSEVSASDTSLTYGGQVGIMVKLTDRIALELGARYFQSKVTTENIRITDQIFKTSMANASLHYH